MQRRIILQNALSISALGVAVSAGLLTPRTVLGAWSEAAFAAKTIPDAVGELGAVSADIEVKAPDIAENGAVVPVTVSTKLPAETITLLAEGNGTPLLGVFELSGAEGYVATRVKLGKSGKVFAVVKAGGKLYHNVKEVKVTIGGCGG
jgi:sulfur-oxidizing protein SoxY